MYLFEVKTEVWYGDNIQKYKTIALAEFESYDLALEIFNSYKLDPTFEVAAYVREKKSKLPIWAKGAYGLI